MISKVHSIAVNGLSSHIIDIEVDISNWLVAFTIVGLPDQGVQESKERLRSALKSVGARLPAKRITVNLAPADIKKVGPCYDLPIALGILLRDGIIDSSDTFEKTLFLWELSLDGKLRSVDSVLPATLGAKEQGFERIFVPKANEREASVIPWIEVFWVESLQEVVEFFQWQKTLIPTPALPLQDFLQKEYIHSFDFSYIIGQEHAKRALEIAAAGGHNIIMSWPPWSGKTMLAKALKTILPNLTVDESIEISKIYSISGLLSEEMPIVTERPFRTVHHTASSASIIGWGRNAKPGEISLAHKWVLFLDEILEFQKQLLEVLRQPLEDGYITVTRVNASFQYPAKCMLVGAMNPCPCGFLTDPDKACICSPMQVKNYQSRLSWPMIDRVDMFIEVPKVKTEKFTNGQEKGSETSKEVKARVEQARQIQQERFRGRHITSNSEMTSKEIKDFCQLSDDIEQILKRAVDSMNLSARSYYRILKLARTIADLETSNQIEAKHILEALSYRKKD